MEMKSRTLDEMEWIIIKWFLLSYNESTKYRVALAVSQHLLQEIFSHREHSKILLKMGSWKKKD